MAQAGASQDNSDLEAHQETFHSFLISTVWVCGHIAQAIMLLTLAFAIGVGWFPGLLAYVAIGVGIGVAFRMSGAYWAAQIVQWVLLGIGGLIVPAIANMLH